MGLAGNERRTSARSREREGRNEKVDAVRFTCLGVSMPEVAQRRAAHLTMTIGQVVLRLTIATSRPPNAAPWAARRP